MSTYKSAEDAEICYILTAKTFRIKMGGCPIYYSPNQLLGFFAAPQS